MATVHQRHKAVTAYRMRQNGSTNNEIAEFLSIDKARIPALVKLGERLDSEAHHEE